MHKIGISYSFLAKLCAFLAVASLAFPAVFFQIMLPENQAIHSTPAGRHLNMIHVMLFFAFSFTAGIIGRVAKHYIKKYGEEPIPAHLKLTLTNEQQLHGALSVLSLIAATFWFFPTVVTMSNHKIGTTIFLGIFFTLSLLLASYMGWMFLRTLPPFKTWREKFRNFRPKLCVH